jgi:hypothetical protein
LKWYYWAGMAVAVVLGLWTLIPDSASKVGLLGYRSHCPFAPISTIVCWLIAGVIYWFGKR